MRTGVNLSPTTGRHLPAMAHLALGRIALSEVATTRYKSKKSKTNTFNQQKIMFKHIIKYSLSALALVGALVSCGKDGGEPTIAEAKGVQFGFSFTAEAHAPLQGDDEARLASYDLEGDKKLPKLNFLHIKNPANKQTLIDGGVPADKVGKVPVHLFFINTKKGQDSRRYYMVWMDVVDTTLLHMPFQNFPAVREQFDTESAEHWYVKAFLGGTVVGSKNEHSDEVFIMMDNLLSVENENSYITNSISKWSTTAKGVQENRYIKKGKAWQIPLPFPMETPWTKVKFYYQNFDGLGAEETAGNGRVEDYPDKPQTFHFKPLGAVLRLQVENKRTVDQPVTVFHFDAAPMQDDGTRNRTQANGDEGGNQPELLAEQIYVNSITRQVTLPPLGADLHPTAAALDNPLASGVTVINRDGTAHYHSKIFKSPSGDSKHRIVNIKAGGKRTFFFWVFEDHRNNLTKQSGYVLPYFHNTFNSNTVDDKRPHNDPDPTKQKHYGPETNAQYKPIYLVNRSTPDRPMDSHALLVKRGQYQSGKTYFIKASLVDAPGTPAQPAQP